MNPHFDMQNLDIGGCTDVGQRKHNEDAYLIDRDLGLVVVADGVGGHQSGEVASAITCEVLQREVAAGSDLRQAIRQANTDVIAAVHSGRGKHGMGSTVVAVLLTEQGYEVAWVGDSRVYLWDGKLTLLTRDHSFVEAQLASGQITLDEARSHPQRHVILQAVGSQESDTLEIGRNCVQLAPNSCLLLCSDGITDPLGNEQLSKLLGRRTSADDTCQRLVEMALQSGGKDNATAVLIAHTGTPEVPPRRTQTDTLVWVYDPETAKYEGLPDITLQNPDHATMFFQMPVARVKPVSTGPIKPAKLTSAETPASGNRALGWWRFWIVVLLSAIGIGLAYLLLGTS